MLPSIGFFKTHNCPFFINGLCERPYCHFKHNKSDFLSNKNGHIIHDEDIPLNEAQSVNVSTGNLITKETDNNDIDNDAPQHSLNPNINREEEFLTFMAKAIRKIKSNGGEEVGNQESHISQQLTCDYDISESNTKSYMHTEYYPKSDMRPYPEYRPTPINQLKNKKCQFALEDNGFEKSISPDVLKLTLKYISNMSNEKLESLKSMFLNKIDGSQLGSDMYIPSKESDKSMYTIFDSLSKTANCGKDEYNMSNQSCSKLSHLTDNNIYLNALNSTSSNDMIKVPLSQTNTLSTTTTFNPFFTKAIGLNIHSLNVQNCNTENDFSYKEQKEITKRFSCVDNNEPLMSPLSPDQEDPDTGVKLNRKTYGYNENEKARKFHPNCERELNNIAYKRPFTLNGKEIKLDEKTTRVIEAAEINNYAKMMKRNDSSQISDIKSLYNSDSPIKPVNNPIVAKKNMKQFRKEDIKFLNNFQLPDSSKKKYIPNTNIDINIFGDNLHESANGDIRMKGKKFRKLNNSLNVKNINHNIINVSSKKPLLSAKGKQSLDLHSTHKINRAKAEISSSDEISKLFSDESDAEASMISISDDEQQSDNTSEVDLDIDLSPQKFKKSVIKEKISKITQHLKVTSSLNASESLAFTKDVLMKVEGYKNDINYETKIKKNSSHENDIKTKRVAHASASNQILLGKHNIKPKATDPIVQPHPTSIMLKRFSGGSKGGISQDELINKRKEVVTSNHIEKGGEAALKKRIAHQPSTQTVNDIEKRPHIQLLSNNLEHQSIPVNVRQRYLNLIHDECLKICRLKSAITSGVSNRGDKADEEASKMALIEETAIFDKCRNNKSLYFNLSVACIKKLRSLGAAQARSLENYGQTVKSLSASKASVNNNYNRFDNLSEEEAFTYYLQHYLMSMDQLKANGYPISELIQRPAHDSGPTSVDTNDNKDGDSFRIVFYDNPDGMALPTPRKRRSVHTTLTHSHSRVTTADDDDTSIIHHDLLCARCGTEYGLALGPGPDDYAYTRSKSECVYHWGKAWKTKATRSRTWETRYTCCRGEPGSPGCCVAPAHVNDDIALTDASYFTTTAAPTGSWVRTANAQTSSVGSDALRAGRAFALDCEMVYTAWGPELARVTVVGYDTRTVYESFVLPRHSPILDYNTRFSGITGEHMKHGNPKTLAQVQTDLLNLVSPDTVLIGHSLESDLLALRMVHMRVVDTAIVFPHRLGLPYKRALKNLMSECLKRIIQDDVDGHDSREDAASCMELMKWKIKQDKPKRG